MLWLTWMLQWDARYVVIVEKHILDFVFSAPARIFFVGIEFTLADPHFLKELHLRIFSLGDKVAFKWKYIYLLLVFFRFRKRKPWIKYKMCVSGLLVNFLSCILSCNMIQSLLAILFWGFVPQLYLVIYILFGYTSVFPQSTRHP